jgi:hypothetical protein
VDEGDRDSLYLLALIVLFPLSLIYLIGRWIIRRTKDRVWADY